MSYRHLTLFCLVLVFLCFSILATAQSRWSTIGPADISGVNSYIGSLELDKYGTPHIAIMEKYGNSWSGYVRRYDGRDWQQLGSIPFVTEVVYMGMSIDSNGTVLVAYIDTFNRGKISMKKHDGATWVQAGPDIICGGDCRSFSMNDAKDGSIYVAYTDDTSNEKITVVKYTGSNWVPVGTRSFSDYIARRLSIAIDNTGTPYVAYSDDGGGVGSVAKLSVVKFDGTAWVYVGSRKFSGELFYDKIELQIDSKGTPYVAYISEQKLSVAKFDGTNWVSVGGVVRNGNASYFSFTLDCNDSLFLGYCYSNTIGQVDKFDGNSWQPVGNTNIGGTYTSEVSLKTDCNGVRYFAIGVDIPSKARVVRQGTSGWTNVGDTIKKVSSAQVSLKFDVNDSLYLVHRESTDNTIRVKKYDGSSWNQVGSVDSFPQSFIFATSLAFDTKNIPYLAYESNFYPGIKKYDGGNWHSLDTTGLGWPYNGILMDIGSNDTPYIAQTDLSNGNKVSVMKYNGTVWVPVGNKYFSAGAALGVAFAVSKNNVPYVAYRDGGNGNRATVMKYDGTNWINVGPVGFSSGYASNFSICFDTNDTPYLAYANDSTLTFYGMAHVKKFDGINWVSVGDTAFSFDRVHDFYLALNKNNTPYVVYKDWVNKAYLTVMKYNGAKWLPVGPSGFSYQLPSTTALAIPSNGTPHVAYNYGDKLSVMRYGCPPQPKVEICAVYTDSNTGNNIIVWNGSNIPLVDSYKIYREANGAYSYLASVAASAGEFTDATANTSTNSYKYKLVVKDMCDEETDISSVTPHKTIMLRADSLKTNTAYISWNSYEGVVNPIYTVKRSNNGSAFVAIATFGIAGTDTVFADVNPPLGNNQYRIELMQPIFCKSNLITSNTITFVHSGIGTLERETNYAVAVVPNPATDNVQIILQEGVLKVEIFDPSGKKLVEKYGHGSKEASVNISALIPGIYFVKVNGIHNVPLIKK